MERKELDLTCVDCLLCTSIIHLHLILTTVRILNTLRGRNRRCVWYLAWDTADADYVGEVISAEPLLQP